MGKVIRGNKQGVQKIRAREIVPGDVVEVSGRPQFYDHLILHKRHAMIKSFSLFSVGDKIPADFRLIHIYSTTLRIDQSILTGLLEVQKFDRLHHYLLVLQESLSRSLSTAMLSRILELSIKTRKISCSQAPMLPLERPEESLLELACRLKSVCSAMLFLSSAILLTIGSVLGKIRTEMVSTETEKTPLQQKLDEFGEQLSKVNLNVEIETA